MDSQKADRSTPETNNGSNDQHASQRRASRSRSRTPRSRSRSPRSRSRTPRSRSGSKDRRRSYSRSRSPSPRSHDIKPEPSKVLGVFGLSSNTREEDLRDEFTKFGEITKVDLIIDKRTGRSRCFGFIYFANLEDAMKARDSCNGMRLDGRNIRIDFSLTKCPHSPTPGRYMGRINRNRRSDSRYDRYSPRRRSPHRDRYDPYDDRYYGRSSRYDDRYGSSYGYGSDRRSDRDYY